MLHPGFTTGNDHYFGSLFAPTVLVQYGDFQCTHCADAYVEIKMLQEMLGNQLLFVFRHYPLTNIHPLSIDAAVACEVAGLQDKFWHMHDIIFENQKYLSRAALDDFAEAIEVDWTLFNDPRAYRKFAQHVILDFDSGVKSGVNGTPTFFINGLRYNGTHDCDSLLKACRYNLLRQEAVTVKNRRY